MTTTSTAPSGGLKARLVAALHHPLRLRILALGAAVLAGYLAIFLPLGGQVDALSTGLAAERSRFALAREIEQLRAEAKQYSTKLQPKPDVVEWGAYVRGGINEHHLRLANFKPEETRDVGPYKAAVLRLELEGAFQDHFAYLRWLESNERLIRVDAIEMYPHKSAPGVLVMKLTVVGVMG